MAKTAGGAEGVRSSSDMPPNKKEKKKGRWHPGHAGRRRSPRRGRKGQRREPNSTSGQRFPHSPSSTARARLPGLGQRSEARIGDNRGGGADARLEAVWRRLFLVGDQCIRTPCPAELMPPRGVSFAWLLETLLTPATGHHRPPPSPGCAKSCLFNRGRAPPPSRDRQQRWLHRQRFYTNQAGPRPIVAAASENSFTHRVQTAGLGRRGCGRAPASPPFGTLGAGHVARGERVALLGNRLGPRG